MSDAIIANAIARRDAALSEARRWTDFIRMYGELTGADNNMQGLTLATGRQIAVTATGALSETEKATGVIIRELGRPVPTRELLELLTARGVEVGGKDPASTLSARLSRAPSLENIRQRGWWIKGRTEGESLGENTPQVRSGRQGHWFLDAINSNSGPVKPGQEVAHDNITDEDQV